MVAALEQLAGARGGAEFPRGDFVRFWDLQVNFLNLKAILYV
jgi:hypothetical protein